MSTLTIFCEKKQFKITGNEIINLELDLNKSPYGHEWNYIGDHLYSFYSKQGCQEQPENKLEVTLFQYEYLKSLVQKSYQ